MLFYRLSSVVKTRVQHIHKKRKRKRKRADHEITCDVEMNATIKFKDGRRIKRYMGLR